MAEWVADDLRTVALSNQKSLYVGAGAPAIPYDGQHWVDISTDPPVMKVYDLTNTTWMTMYPIYYETQVGAWAAPTQSPITNGTIVVLYNSDVPGTRLYGRSNGAWVNFAGTIVRVYPAGDQTAENDGGNAGLAAGGIKYATIDPFVAGTSTTMVTQNITPSEDNSTVCVTGFGIFAAEIAGSTFTVRLYLDTTLVDSLGPIDYNPIIVPVILKGYVDSVTSAAHTIKLDVYKNAGPDATGFYYMSVGVTGVSVIT